MENNRPSIDQPEDSFRLDNIADIETKLEPGESILWQGKPRQGIFLQAADAFLIPFSLLWGGFAFFWELGVILDGKSVLMVLFGIPFTCIGIFFIVGRFFVDANVRDCTRYTITNRRIIIATGIFKRTIRVLEIARLTEIEITQHGDGRGTITFSKEPFNSHPPIRNRGNFLVADTNQPALIRVEKPKEIYNLLRDLSRRAPTEPASNTP